MAHNEFMAEHLGFIDDSLHEISSLNASVTMARAMNRLDAMRERSATFEDLQFVNDITDLLRRRRAFLDFLPVAHSCSCAAGFALSLALAFIFQNLWTALSLVMYFASLVLWGAYYLIFSDLRPDGRVSFGAWDAFATTLFSSLYLPFRYRWTLGSGMRREGFFLIVWWGSGAIFGLTLSYGVSRWMMREYIREIKNLCEDYCG